MERSVRIKTKVVIAMSGGVDSSVAAALLKKQGYDVVGVTMQLWAKSKTDACEKENIKSCCSVSAVEDARRVADQLNIPYYVLNFREIFKRSVIDNFMKEYNLGRTPNPCIKCNEIVKFKALLQKAKELGAEYLATGHYARVGKIKGRYFLKKGKDPGKDQTYFLYPLTQDALAHTLFPLGGLKKAEVRRIAVKLGLSTAQKPESQEICFVEGSYKGLFSPKEGQIVDKKGKILGKHHGYQLYTIGQRRGLGISSPEPLYVTKIDPKDNKITVGNKGDVYGDDLIAGHVNLITMDKLTKPMKVKAMIRYNSPVFDVNILPLSQGKIKVTFNKPQFAISPGQSVVFYKGDTVIGGGIIESEYQGIRKSGDQRNE
jgi:tRNA-uridine 2-sulfurtransferase